MAARVRVNVDDREFQVTMRRLNQAAVSLGGSVVRVGSNLVYAYGIEHGRHRGGSLARAAGGAFMLRNALQAVHPRIKSTIAAALLHGEQAARQALLRLGYDVERGAKATVPVKTGSLRRSLHTVASDR